MSATISATIDIDAAPDVVWEVLADFAAYDQWNPAMRIDGSPEVGARLVVDLLSEEGKATTFKPTVLVATPGRELRWIGRLLVKGVFDGEHSFVLETAADGTTHLVHGERFSGLLVFFLQGTLRKTQARFEAFNGALKRHVETASARR